MSVSTDELADLDFDPDVEVPKTCEALKFKPLTSPEPQLCDRQAVYAVDLVKECGHHSFPIYLCELCWEEMDEETGIKRIWRCIRGGCNRFFDFKASVVSWRRI
jgi:hypothetical protein